MQTSIEIFKELIERSQTEKRGLTVYFNGQAITGIARRVIDDQALELVSQQFHQAVIRLEVIEAMSVN